MPSDPRRGTSFPQRARALDSLAGRSEKRWKKVIFAFEREKSADRIREILETAGLGDYLICRSAAEVKRLVHKQRVTTVVCGYKLSDETAETLFDDLPSSCSMLVVAIQSMLNLMGNDEIFRLAAPVSRSDLVASVRMLDRKSVV